MAVRSKQVEIMIDEMNEILKNRGEISELCSDCLLFTHLLLKSKCYRGFGWFYDYPYTDVTGVTRTISTLALTSDPVKLKAIKAYIQYY